MPTWLQILLACGGSVVITLIITELFNFIKRRHQQNNTMREDEKHEELKQLIRNELKPLRDDLETIKKGTQAVLRHDLYEIYNKGIASGYSSQEEKTDFENIYINYHNLGENGVMDKNRKKFLALPDTKEEKQKLYE